VSLGLGLLGEGRDVSSPSLATDKLFQSSSSSDEGKRAKPRAVAVPGNKALDIFWDKRIREAGKMVRHSPLFPRARRRSGKSQFNWTSTTDLISHWPISFFIWAAIGVGLASLAATFWYTQAFSPAPLSRSHTRAQLNLFPAIAIRSNADSCTNCHSLNGSIEEQCAGCHNTAAFVSTVIKPHADAGIGCVTCHAEHRGPDFSPAHGALASCTSCHNDSNKLLYNGRRVATPHGGTFGYPVKDGKWSLKSIDDEGWALKKIAVTRLPTETDEQWRSKQFHSLHVQRVLTVPGIPGNAQGELSCSSCHKSFNPIDRSSPRTTCGSCHNGKVDPSTNKVLIAQDQPNCTSCHVQHIKDKRTWSSSMLAVR
jgi:hypothetical protein